MIQSHIHVINKSYTNLQVSSILHRHGKNILTSLKADRSFNQPSNGETLIVSRNGQCRSYDLPETIKLSGLKQRLNFLTDLYHDKLEKMCLITLIVESCNETIS